MVKKILPLLFLLMVTQAFGAPPGPKLTSIRIQSKQGYTTLPVGDAIAPSVVGVYDDGSAIDVTSEVTWQSSDSSVAQISPQGQERAISAVGVGTATVTATYQDVSGAMDLTVTASRRK